MLPYGGAHSTNEILTNFLLSRFEMRLAICTLILVALNGAIAAAGAPPAVPNAAAVKKEANVTSHPKPANATSANNPVAPKSPPAASSVVDAAKPVAPAVKPKDEETRKKLVVLENRIKATTAAIDDLKKKIDGSKDPKEKAPLEDQLKNNQKRLENLQKSLKDCQAGGACGDVGESPPAPKPAVAAASVPPVNPQPGTGAQKPQQNADKEELIESLKLAILLSRINALNPEGADTVPGKEVAPDPLPRPSATSGNANVAPIETPTATATSTVNTLLPTGSVSPSSATTTSSPRPLESNTSATAEQNLPQSSTVTMISYSKSTSLPGAKRVPIPVTEPGLLESSAICGKPILLFAIAQMFLIGLF